MTERNLVSPRRTHTNRGRSRGKRGAGAETTVAGVTGFRGLRFFNTTGPVVAADHYCILPLDRLDLEDLLRLVRDKRYLVPHAARQTGKTSALLALRDRLNAGGYRCVYVNVEVAQDGPPGRRTDHAYAAGPAGVSGEDDPGRRVPGRRLSGSAGDTRRTTCCWRR